MTPEREIRLNQAKIKKLAVAIGLWINTPHAQNADVRATVNRLQDNTLKRLRELEIEGQRVKIANMEKVVGLLKEGQTTMV